MSAQSRFVVLDSFRGLCALSVVLFHIHIWQSPAQWSYFRSAGLLVEFFFVLSGFVLAHRYTRRPLRWQEWGDFMLSRSCRILPLHLAMFTLICSLLYLRPLLYDAPWQQLDELFWSREMVEQGLYNLFLVHAWLPQGLLFSFNGPAWSISIEYYLYVLFALVLCLSGRRQRWWFAAMVVCCSIGAWILPAQLATSPGLRGLSCFFLGALLHGLQQRLAPIPLRRSLATALEAAVLLGLYAMITFNYPHKSFWAGWGFALAILVFASERGQISSWLRHPWLVRLGEWSYSVYLTHFVLLFGVGMLISRYLPHWDWENRGVAFWHTGSWLGNQVLLLALVAGILLFSSYTYRWIEQPGIALGKRLRRRQASTSGELAMAASRA
ncbi:acyltransferase family protein [Chitinibacter tainanensis]|uniref:acyltransferase family protein n=1 Tax=Chitinibacter tainanensis TaxID=230667 RepID=UPI0003F4C727|nr:acyltransferase [Chitinibacter tainanensis]